MELKKDNTIRCNYTIPKYIVELLSEHKEIKNISRSKLITYLLDEYFKKEFKENYNKNKKD